MSTPCTTCGEPLDPTADRCATCGALASPADATVVSDAPPWSIPIREPAAVAAAPDDERRGRTVGFVLLAVLVLAAAVVGATRLLDDDSGTTTGDTAQADPVGTDERGGFDPDAVRSSTTATTPTSAVPPTSETTEPTTTTTAAPTTTSAPAPRIAPATPPTTAAGPVRTGPNGTGSVPALSTGFRGWLAQLTSVPYDAGTDGLADEWKRLQGAAPGAVALRSDDWSAFRDGFWVLVDPGPFSSPDEVRAFCARAGFDGDSACLPRELRG